MNDILKENLEIIAEKIKLKVNKNLFVSSVDLDTLIEELILDIFQKIKEDNTIQKPYNDCHIKEIKENDIRKKGVELDSFYQSYKFVYNLLQKNDKVMKKLKNKVEV